MNKGQQKNSKKTIFRYISPKIRQGLIENTRALEDQKNRTMFTRGYREWKKWKLFVREAKKSPAYFNDYWNFAKNGARYGMFIGIVWGAVRRRGRYSNKWQCICNWWGSIISDLYCTFAL